MVEELEEQKRKTILDTLHFSQVKEREFAIPDAHKNTFQWIFNEDRNNFVAWLRQSDDIYWITGKAGSGKSTLMRFLTDHRDTRLYLKEWAGEKSLLVAKHYFWSPGTAIQRSQEGLFRTLLLQILNQRPDLIPIVCADRWEAPFADAFNPWSRGQLMAAFSKLGSLETLDCGICRFIDGLDEYDGDHTQLVSVIRQVGGSDNIKVCASSRPWLEFLDAFQHSKWSLRLEDLTHDDVCKYVRDKLNDDVRFSRLKQDRKAAAEGLGLEITKRANGVFLWVFLVVRSLLRGLRNEDDVSDLQRRLRELPNDLREYFDRMLDTIDSVYKERTARLFITMAYARTTFPVITFYFMDLGDGTARGEFLRNWPDVDIDETEVLGTKRRQLIAQCKDLISITPDPGAGILFSERVGFLHRTVVDYIHTPEIQSRLIPIAGTDFSVNKILLETNLGQLRALIHLHARTYIYPHLCQRILGCLYYAHILEVISGNPETDALDELETIITGAFVKWGFSHAMVTFFKKPGIMSFLQLACQCDLASYVCKKYPQLTPSRLDTLAPGWRILLEIQRQSTFKLCEREMTEDLYSDWRLGRQLKVPFLSQQEAKSLEEKVQAPIQGQNGAPVKSRKVSWRALLKSLKYK